MMVSIIRSLLADRRGASVSELALIVPLLAGLIFCGVDLANGFAARLKLEQAAGRAIEMASAPGTVSKGGYEYLRSEAASASGQPAGNVVIDNWVECDGVRKSSFTTVCTGGQQTARYVSVRVNALYQPLFNFMGLIFGPPVPTGGVSIFGDAMVRVQ